MAFEWTRVLLYITMIYETGVLIFGTLPTLTEWYGAGGAVADVETLKWLYLVALIVHFLIFAGMMWRLFNVKYSKRRWVHALHYAMGIFAYVWPTVATWVLHPRLVAESVSGLEFDLSDPMLGPVSLKYYILTKVALILAAIAAVVVMNSAITTIRVGFEHRRMSKV